MLSAKGIFEEIFGNDEAFRLFCSIAASGEAQGGWENGRIAALVPESYQDLAPKIARHGADEDKHGRIFTALLRRRGLEPVPVPAETDYTMRLEHIGLGLAHSQLRRDEKLSEQDIIAYLTHSRVTEQRASEQMRALRKYAGSRPDIGRAITMICDDEDNHLAYCHEELLKLASAGHADTIRGTLRVTALAEIAVYRDVSKAVMANLARILHWPRPKAAMLVAGIQAVYLYERLGGWRRMVSLQPPARRNALGGPPPARTDFASASSSSRLPPMSGRATAWLPDRADHRAGRPASPRRPRQTARSPCRGIGDPVPGPLPACTCKPASGPGQPEGACYDQDHDRRHRHRTAGPSGGDAPSGARARAHPGAAPVPE
jgi:hypothetical protein